MQFKISWERRDVLTHLKDVQAAADGARNEFGFLPSAAYSEAAARGHLILAVNSEKANESIYAGHLMYGGVYPHARVFQTHVAAKFRGTGLGGRLLRTLIAKLENENYLSARALVASDLTNANKFYDSHGFHEIRQQRGGDTRQRTLIVRSLELDTPTLFNRKSPSSKSIPVSLHSSNPFYVIDLNIFFDAVRNREHAEQANAIISAALSHEISLAIAPEFLVELQRSSLNEANDPALTFARSLPTLPTCAVEELNPLARRIEELVFPNQFRMGITSPRDVSDTKHIAASILARASGFITRENAILRSRAALFDLFGIDVLGPDEFRAWLSPPEPRDIQAQNVAGIVFRENVVKSEAITLFDRCGAPSSFVDSLRHQNPLRRPSIVVEAREGGRLVGAIAWNPTVGRDAPTVVLMAVSQDHASALTVSDYLLDYVVRQISSRGPSKIELVNLANMPVGRRVATQMGFFKGRRVNGEFETLVKFAAGGVYDTANWATVGAAITRQTGARTPQQIPNQGELLELQLDGENTLSWTLSEFEAAFSPCIVLAPGRGGTLVPIQKMYADDLLGTRQLSLLARPEAVLRSRRTYISSPRNAKLLKPGTPIVFYESGKGDGRSAAIAIARVAESVVYPKTEIPHDAWRTSVISKRQISSLNTSDAVLATSFENLLVFANPITHTKLKTIGVEDPRNFVTSFAIDHKILAAIAVAGAPGA